LQGTAKKMPNRRGQTPGGPLHSRTSSFGSQNTAGPGGGLLPPIRLSDTPDLDRKRRKEAEARRLPLATINSEVQARPHPTPRRKSEQVGLWGGRTDSRDIV